MVEAIATGLGLTLRALLRFLRIIPGIAAPVGLVYGIWLYDYRVAIIVGSMALFLLDVRIGAGPPQGKETE